MDKMTKLTEIRFSFWLENHHRQAVATIQRVYASSE